VTHGSSGTTELNSPSAETELVRSGHSFRQRSG